MSRSQDFLKFLDDTPSKEDVAQLFKKLIDYLKETKQKLDEEGSKQRSEIDAMVSEALSTLTTKVSESETKLNSRQDLDKQTMYSENRTTLRLIEQGLNDLRAELPEAYDDTEIRRLIAETREAIPQMPEAFDASDIVEDIEEHEEKIQRLEKELEELKARPVGRGGGVSALGVQQAFKYILKTEAVQGTIDGVNTDFTVSKPIFAILSLSLNGEVVAQLPNYTISGNKLTFSSPIPAAYSGADFEAKYV